MLLSKTFIEDICETQWSFAVLSISSETKTHSLFRDKLSLFRNKVSESSFRLILS